MWPCLLDINQTRSTVVHSQSNRIPLCHSLIYMSSFVLVEKKCLSPAHTVLKINIRISFGSNWDRSYGSSESPDDYINLVSTSSPFSMKDGSKHNDFELVLQESANNKKVSILER